MAEPNHRLLYPAIAASLALLTALAGLTAPRERPSERLEALAPDRGAAHLAVSLPPKPAATTAPKATARNVHYVRQSTGGTAVGAGGRQTKTALVIGINHAVGGEPLTAAVLDAQNVRKALIGYGFPARNIQVLTESAATRPAILAGLRSLAARTASNGVAVFAVATHSSQSSFRTAEGARISARELAGYLGAIRGRVWSLLATCFAGAYSLPGIVGHGRIATFSSSSDDKTWEVVNLGSWLVLYMVRYGMLEGGAPRSVESAFRYAKSRLLVEKPNRVPVMTDGIPGDLVLGPVPETQIDPVSTVTSQAPEPVVVPEPTPNPTPVPVQTTTLFGGLLRILRR